MIGWPKECMSMCYNLRPTIWASSAPSALRPATSDVDLPTNSNNAEQYFLRFQIKKVTVDGAPLSGLVVDANAISLNDVVPLPQFEGLSVDEVRDHVYDTTVYGCLVPHSN